MIFEDDEQTQNKLKEFWSTSKVNSTNDQPSNSSNLTKRKRSKRIMNQKNQRRKLESDDIESNDFQELQSKTERSNLNYSHIDSSKFWSGEINFNYRIIKGENNLTD